MTPTLRRQPEYKQMALETAVRNPERYKGILVALSEFENRILDDECLLEIVCKLYLIGEVSSDNIVVSDTTTIDAIKNDVITVNSTRNADGGFPRGYASRFWTYMRTPSELGFVFARYNEKFQISDVAKKLIQGDLDEQEAFSIQAMKYNRKSPYRNVSNDYNFFHLVLEILLILKGEGSKLTYEQFIIAMFNKSGKAKETLDILKNNKFPDVNAVYLFVKNHYGNNNKIRTVTKDYPDVVKRVMILAGFISIRYAGKVFFEINENKIDYIKDIMQIDFSLSANEKLDAESYFNKLNSGDSEFLEILEKHKKDDDIDGDEYANKIYEIIKVHSIDEKKILECISKVEDYNFDVIPEFSLIPPPLKLEFFIAILIALKYKKQFSIKPNYKVDHFGKPYSHAPGYFGDIDVYSDTTYWLIEVTLIRNKDQQLNSETTSVIRHLNEANNLKSYSSKYLSFVSPKVHIDTKEFYDISIVKNQSDGHRLSMKPYDLAEFINITVNVENLSDMETYTAKIFDDFKSKLSK